MAADEIETWPAEVLRCGGWLVVRRRPRTLDDMTRRVVLPGPTRTLDDLTVKKEN